MSTIAAAGNGQTTKHRGTVTFKQPLPGFPSKYAVLATAQGAILAPVGAHVIGFELDSKNNFKAFEVFTDEAIATFSWIVVKP